MGHCVQTLCLTYLLYCLPACSACVTVFAAGMARVADIRNMKLHDLAAPYEGPDSVGPIKLVIQQIVLPQAKTFAVHFLSGFIQ